MVFVFEVTSGMLVVSVLSALAVVGIVVKRAVERMRRGSGMRMVVVIVVLGAVIRYGDNGPRRRISRQNCAGAREKNHGCERGRKKKKMDGNE